MMIQHRSSVTRKYQQCLSQAPAMRGVGAVLTSDLRRYEPLLLRARALNLWRVIPYYTFIAFITTTNFPKQPY